MDTAVVTGATGGIGAALTRHLAAEGTHVVAGARDDEALTQLAASLEDDAAGGVTTLRTDVRDEFDVERLLERAAKVDGEGIDLLVPCAAVYHGEAGETPIDEESYSAFDDTIRTNVRGVFAVLREAVPHLTEDARVLVPTGSVGEGVNPGYGAYAVSKAAGEAVARGFAGDIDQPVGVVDPGVVATDLTGGRGREPEDVVGLFEWAASLDAEALDGETLGLREWRQAQRD